MGQHTKGNAAETIEKVIGIHTCKAKLLQKSKITQQDLIEERLLTNEALRAMKALFEKREEIRRKLELGSPIESGYHDAHLSARHRSDGSIYFSLMVR